MKKTPNRKSVLGPVLVTGASRGIGEALTSALRTRGYSVLAYKRSELGDIRDLLTILKLKEMAEKASIKVLVNCAGVYSDRCMSDTTVEDIEEIIEVNLIAPMVLTKALWPILVETHGMVININSIAGRVVSTGEIAYRSSKFGLAGFSRVLALEGKKSGVRVIDIPFGGVNTDMVGSRCQEGWSAFQQPSSAADLIVKVMESAKASGVKHKLLHGEIIDN